MVLLVSLNESSYNLIDGRNSGGFPNLVEGIFNDLGVAHVLVEKLLLLLVEVDDLAKSELKNLNGVGEFSLLTAWPLSFFDGLVEAFVIELNRIVSFLQSFLKLFDFELKPFFLLFVLRFQSKDLVVSFFRVLRVRDVVLVRRSCVFLYLVDYRAHLLDVLPRKHYFLSHYLDFVFQVVVLPYCVVQPHFLIGQFMNNVALLNLFLMIFFFRWNHLLYFLFLLHVLCFHVFVLVFKN